MNFNYGKEITVAMAHRTREVLLARRALCAAAGIHTTTVVMLLACLAIPIHAVLA
jgi:enamine deaminase RidA (YjgF/YER057c/UK114 family)